jgi:hypothetical protein
MRKYNYLLVIQQHFGQGWEDVSEYDATSKGVAIDREPNGKTTFSHDLKEYRLAGYPTRFISRREKREGCE